MYPAEFYWIFLICITLYCTYGYFIYYFLLFIIYIIFMIKRKLFELLSFLSQSSSSSTTFTSPAEVDLDIISMTMAGFSNTCNTCTAGRWSKPGPFEWGCRRDSCSWCVRRGGCLVVELLLLLYYCSATFKEGSHI